jgi:hypothetical protein
MTITTNLKQLYETDEDLWLEKTIELLKQKQFNQLDLENLIEELISYHLLSIIGVEHTKDEFFVTIATKLENRANI